jgi:hypothetical protein
MELIQLVATLFCVTVPGLMLVAVFDHDATRPQAQ